MRFCVGFTIRKGSVLGGFYFFFFFFFMMDFYSYSTAVLVVGS